MNLNASLSVDSNGTKSIFLMVLVKNWQAASAVADGGCWDRFYLFTDYLICMRSEKVGLTLQ